MSIVYVVSSLEDSQYRIIRGVAANLPVGKSLAVQMAATRLQWHDEQTPCWAVEGREDPEPGLLWEVAPHVVSNSVWTAPDTGAIVRITLDGPLDGAWAGVQ